MFSLSYIYPATLSQLGFILINLITILLLAAMQIGSDHPKFQKGKGIFYPILSLYLCITFYSLLKMIIG